MLKGTMYEISHFSYRKGAKKNDCVYAFTFYRLKRTLEDHEIGGREREPSIWEENFSVYTFLYLH